MHVNPRRLAGPRWLEGQNNSSVCELKFCPSPFPRPTRSCLPNLAGKHRENKALVAPISCTPGIFLLGHAFFTLRARPGNKGHSVWVLEVQRDSVGSMDRIGLHSKTRGEEQCLRFHDRPFLRQVKCTGKNFRFSLQIRKPYSVDRCSAAKSGFQLSITNHPPSPLSLLLPPRSASLPRSMSICTLWNSFIECFHVHRLIRGWSSAVMQLSMHERSSANWVCSATVLRQVRPIPTLLSKVISFAVLLCQISHKTIPSCVSAAAGGSRNGRTATHGSWCLVWPSDLPEPRECETKQKLADMVLSRGILTGLDPSHCENEFGGIIFVAGDILSHCKVSGQGLLGASQHCLLSTGRNLALIFTLLFFLLRTSCSAPVHLFLENPFGLADLYGLRS